MLVVTTVLAALALLKLLAMLQAIRWLYVHGPAYREDVTRAPPVSDADLGERYARLHGAFFPFGIKEYRLRRWSARASAHRLRLAAAAGRALRVLFMLPALVAVVAVSVVLWVSVPGLPDVAPAAVTGGLLLATVFVLVATTILLAAEAAIAYAVLGSYGVAFHSATALRTSRHRAILQELQVFVGAAVFSHLASTSAVLLVDAHFGGYGAMDSDPADGVAGALGRALDAYYLTFMVFAGGDTPDPLGPMGKIATGLTAAQGLVLLILVLAIMVGALQRAPVPPADATAAPPPPVPRSRSPWVRAAGGTAGLAALGLVVMLWLRRRRGRR